MKENGEACVLITVVEMSGSTPVTVGKKMLVREDGFSIGTIGGGPIEYLAKKRCKELLGERNSKLEKYVLNEGKVKEEGATVLPMACGGKVTLFYEYIGANKVYIFGGGHVGQALINILYKMNFLVTVIDDRKEICDTIENAHIKIKDSYVDFIEKEKIDKDSFVVVCTPSHNNDFNILNKIIELDFKPKYIGMLCSQVKLESFYKRILVKHKKVDFSNLYSPVGLDIGGCSPEEIAVSIAAEILAISYNKKDHKHLRNSELLGKENHG
jgi:xanthine dehydrogenase accessory factor